MTDVFISYASPNLEAATKLRDSIESSGLKCWMAPRDIPPGTEYGEEIIKGLENSRVFLLCLSNASNTSPYVAREVERAIGKKLPVITYQLEKVELNKSLEYFLASTQWFNPQEDDQNKMLIHAIQTLSKIRGNDSVIQPDTNGSSNDQPSNTESSSKDGYTRNVTTTPNKNLLWVSIFTIFCSVILIVFIVLIPKIRKDSTATTALAYGDVFTFGYLGDDSEALEWTVLDIDEEKNQAICLSNEIVLFGPYDAAESGSRGQYDDKFYQSEQLKEYSPEELVKFWGSSDWSSSNIRTWLNSKDAVVSYSDMAPIEDGTTIYENSYDTKPGFLYYFSKEEQDQLLPFDTTYVTAAGDTVQTTDSVFLLSKEEADRLLMQKNLLLAAKATSFASTNEGSGIFQSYQDEGKHETFWALRTYGEIPSCTIMCAGVGMNNSEQYHSEYACSSLIGIRPVIVLPLDVVLE